MKTNLFIGKNTTEKMIEEIKNSIENNENLLVLNDDTTYYDTYKKQLEEKNYNIYVLNLEDSSKSNSFNPLMLPYNYYKKGNQDKCIDLISVLAKEIFRENSSVDPFWENSAINYFTALTLILFKEGNEDQINLGSIQAMLTLAEKSIDNTSIIEKYFDNLDLLNSIYIAGSPIVYAPNDTRGSIMSVTKQKLNTYCIREMLLNNLCGNDIDLANINSNTAIFIINSNNKIINKIGNILVDELSMIKIPFTYCMNINKNDNICELDNILGNNKVYISVSNQDILESLYDRNVLNKFDNKEEINCDLIMTSEEELPISKLNDKKYFDFEKFVKEI